MGCRTRRPATSLVRYVRTAAGELVESTASNGRGAWLCRSRDCLNTAIRRRAFDKTLRGTITTESLERLTSTIEQGHQPTT